VLQRRRQHPACEASRRRCRRDRHGSGWRSRNRRRLLQIRHNGVIFNQSTIRQDRRTAMNFLAVMALPLLACLLLVLILPALGRHVLARGVIFVDLALAQIAALGQSVAFLLGADPHDPSTYYWSFGFTLLGAALFSFLCDREHSVLQEAFI